QIRPPLAGHHCRDSGVVQSGGSSHLPQASLPNGVAESDRELLGVSRFDGTVDAPVGPLSFHQVRAGWSPKSDLSCHAATINQEFLCPMSFPSGMVYVRTGLVR